MFALQAQMASQDVTLCSYLSPQQRLALLQHDHLKLVSAGLVGDVLSIKGARELVSQVNSLAC